MGWRGDRRPRMLRAGKPSRRLWTNGSFYKPPQSRSLLIRMVLSRANSSGPNGNCDWSIWMVRRKRFHCSVCQCRDAMLRQDLYLWVGPGSGPAGGQAISYYCDVCRHCVVRSIPLLHLASLNLLSDSLSKPNIYKPDKKGQVHLCLYFYQSLNHRMSIVH